MAGKVLSGKANIKGMMANSTVLDHPFMYPKGGGGVPQAKPIVTPHHKSGGANQSVSGNIGAAKGKVIGK